jgi:hypothetical protein
MSVMLHAFVQVILSKDILLLQATLHRAMLHRAMLPNKAILLNKAILHKAILHNSKNQAAAVSLKDGIILPNPFHPLHHDVD